MPRPIIYFVAEWLTAAWRRRYLLVIPILIMPFAGAGIGFVAPKSYSAHTSVLIQEAAITNPFLADLAVNTALDERFSMLETLLHSRHVLNGVAEDLGLITATTTEEGRDWHIERLSSMLNLTMVGKSLLELSARGSDKDMLEPLLTAASARLIDRVLAPAKSAIDGSNAFLQRELADRRVDLERAEAAVADYRATHATELPEVQAANIARLNQLRAVLMTKRGELAAAEARFASRNATLSETNPMVARLEQEEVRLRAELALLRARYTDQHSRVQAVQREVARMEEERNALLLSDTKVATKTSALWNVATHGEIMENGNTPSLLVEQLGDLQTDDAERRALNDEIANLEQEMARLEEMIASQGRHERQLAELNRDLAVKQAVYEDLAKRAEMALVTGALGRFEESEQVRVIDRPFTPTAPDTLPAWIFVAAGIITGTALGVGLALLAEIADTSLRRGIDVERLTGLPVLGRLPPCYGSWPAQVAHV